MSTDFSIRPVGAPAATAVAQPVSHAADNAVATELPAAQAVTAIDTSVGSPYVSHQAILDQAAATIVYQVVDNRTHQVVQQFPDEAVLRRRAYFRALDLSGGEPIRPLATDRRA
jgi:hypothetical protein